jgi:hypothetical protein
MAKAIGLSIEGQVGNNSKAQKALQHLANHSLMTAMEWK